MWGCCAGTSVKSGTSASSGRSNMDTIGAPDVGQGPRMPTTVQDAVGNESLRGQAGIIS